MSDDLAPPLAASQHEPGPRPLPLFLELIRDFARRDPVTARAALDGLRRYQSAARGPLRVARPEIVRVGAARLRDCGGSGRPVILVPSLINPPDILDLDPDCSLAQALLPEGRILLLDWGRASRRASLAIADHVEQLLLPLIAELGEPVTLVGYCLGGTMALAAAAINPQIRAVATLAAPWHFSAYPAASRRALADYWQSARPAAEALGTMPIELLQAAFWSLDPDGVVTKFARFAALDLHCAKALRFVTLEDWANSGEALPLPAAQELIGRLFGEDLTGGGKWLGRGIPECPTLHFTASEDRIVPASATAPGARIDCPAGHVGMVVGQHAPNHLHGPLRAWLAAR